MESAPYRRGRGGSEWLAQGRAGGKWQSLDWNPAVGIQSRNHDGSPDRLGGPWLTTSLESGQAACRLLPPALPFLPPDKQGLTYMEMQAEKLLGPMPSRANCYVLPRSFSCSFIHS